MAIKVTRNVIVPEELRHFIGQQTADKQARPSPSFSSDPVLTNPSDDDGSGEPTGDNELDAPTSVVFVDPQTMRTMPDGTMVVDVVIDVAEVFGALNYEVRVAKV